MPRAALQLAAFAALCAACFEAGGVTAAHAQAPASKPAAAPAPVRADPPGPGIVVRRVVMKDSLSADQFREKLEDMKKEGLFRVLLPSDPKAPKYRELSFLTSGNYLLVTGDQGMVDSQIQTIRMMAFLYERPRAHLQLNVRVVQLTGPANTDVIQMTDTVKALVDTQRTQVVRAFADLQDYLLARLKRRTGKDLQVYQEVRKILPSLGEAQRPLTVPEILLLMMIDRALPAMPDQAAGSKGAQVEDALTALPQHLEAAVQDPRTQDAATAKSIATDLAKWKQAVGEARDWCKYYGDQLDKKDGVGIAAFADALQRPDCPLPQWVALRLRRSLDMTNRLYPDLAAKQTVESVRELERRFSTALDRAGRIERDLDT